MSESIHDIHAMMNEAIESDTIEAENSPTAKELTKLRAENERLKGDLQRVVDEYQQAIVTIVSERDAAKAEAEEVKIERENLLNDSQVAKIQIDHFKAEAEKLKDDLAYAIRATNTDRS